MRGADEAPAPSGGRTASLLVAGLAAYLLLLGVLLRPAGGLEGTYLIRDAEGKEVLVHRRVDRRIDFPVSQRLDAAYLFHWDLKRHGFPASMPPYFVRWSGHLLAPKEGLYRLSVEAQGEASLRLDGQPVEFASAAAAERRLGRGWHPIDLDYSLSQGDARLILRWQPPGGRLEVIPADHLAVDPASHRRAGVRRFVAWLLLAAGAGTTLVVAALGRRGGGMAGRIAAGVLAERSRIALGAIVILAALLRFHDYALVPFHHETADEYQHAWEGWHLLHQGFPAAWSTFPDRYPVEQTLDFRWFGDRYVLVRPYFDHPPLFSIPVGLLASLAGAPTFLSCSLPVMRLVPIVLSLAGILLLYRLALHYGASERGALLAGLVYAVLPVIVLSHRLVKAESLLSLLFMGAILAVGRHEGSGRARDAALAGLLCGLSIWTKATGVAVVVTVVVLLLSRRRYRGAGLVLLIAAGFLVLYLAYAWAYDFGIFLEVVRAQSTTKWVSLDSLLDLLRGKVVVKYFGRGFYLWLLLCAGVAAFRKERALLVPLAIYVTLVALTADQRVIYGWYRIPLYPFLCVAAGIYLEEMVETSDLFRTFPFAITAVATGLLYAFHTLPFAAAAETTVRTALPTTMAWTKGVMLLFMILFVLPHLLRLVHDRPATGRLARVATQLLVVLWAATSVATVGRLLEIYSATRGLQ